MPRSLLLHLIVLSALLAGCATTTPQLTQAPTITTQPVSTAASIASPTTTPSPNDTATPLPPTATAAPRLCSPISGFALDQLAVMISNPFHPPPPGSDDPHHGVDLAVRMAGSQVAIAGNPVQAAIAGRVVMVNNDRFPYGNSIMIETPLVGAQAEWLAQADIPVAAPTLENHSALTCPNTVAPATNASHRSLYVLYAHMASISDLQVGDEISCGQLLGTVGDTGNALNPHLHFETRVGPSGVHLPGMAHYDVSATTDEMSGYCTWRISGLFQLVDPMKVLSLTP